MAMTYMNRRRAENSKPAQQQSRAAQGPSLAQLAAGAAPTQEQMGRQVDLPEAIRAKMEASFGADFSNVKVYESQTVADAGAQAMTMGSSVMFAPGQLDFASSGGQALLGHELSHVVSQARGESRGVGFLRDAGLEAQADRQGAMAAAGESVYSGPLTPISSTSTAASAAGPMQAKKPKKDKQPAGDVINPMPEGYSEKAMGGESERRSSANMAVQRAVAGLSPEYIQAHPEILEGLATGAGQKANESLKNVTEDQWKKGADQFRGSSGNNPYMIGFQAMMGRKMEMGEGGQEDALSGKLQGAGHTEEDLALLNQRMDDSGVTDALKIFTNESFKDGAGSQFTPEQKSSMVMQNFMTRAVNGTVGPKVGMDKVKGVQKGVSIDTNTGMGRDSTASTFLNRMSGVAGGTEAVPELHNVQNAAPAPAAAPAGKQTSDENFSYRNTAVTDPERKGGYDITQMSEDEQLANLKHWIKNPGDASPEQVSNWKKQFAQLRAQQMESQRRKGKSSW